MSPSHEGDARPQVWQGVFLGARQRDRRQRRRTCAVGFQKPRSGVENRTPPLRCSTGEPQIFIDELWSAKRDRRRSRRTCATPERSAGGATTTPLARLGLFHNHKKRPLFLLHEQPPKRHRNRQPRQRQTEPQRRHRKARDPVQGEGNHAPQRIARFAHAFFGWTQAKWIRTIAAHPHPIAPTAAQRQPSARHP